MTKLTDEQIAAIRDGTEGVTPGPWQWGKKGFAEELVGTLYGAAGAVICDFGDATQYYPSEGEMPDERDAANTAAILESYPEVLAALRKAEAVIRQRKEAEECLMGARSARHILPRNYEALEAAQEAIRRAPQPD